MNKRPVFLILLISIVVLFFYLSDGTDSVDPKQTTVEENKSSENTIDEQSAYSFDDHPCLCLTEGVLPESDLSDRYYKKTKYLNDKNNFNQLEIFHILMESSILINHYSEFMRALEPIILRKKINEHFNPKYYFISSLRNLYKGDHQNAKKNLEEFLIVKNKYEKDRNYFHLGCYEKDLDWILNVEDSEIYKISKILLDYSTLKISNKFVDGKIEETVNKLHNLHDSTPDEYGLIENIIFILLYSEGLSIAESNNFLDLSHSPSILYSSIDEMFDDEREYYLPSQLDMISISKYYQALDTYKQFDWDKIFANANRSKAKAPFSDWKMKQKHVYSLMHLYENKINLFNQVDTLLYNRIKRIINSKKAGIENLDVWLDSYSPSQRLFNKTKLGKIKNISWKSIDELMDLLDYDYLSDPNDSITYFMARDSFVDEDLFKSISSGTIDYVIEVPVEEYKIKINKFFDIKNNFEYPNAFNMNISVPEHLFSIYDICTIQNTAIDISGYLAQKSVLNEGSEAIFKSWNIVRSYCEESNTGTDTDKCK